MNPIMLQTIYYAIVMLMTFVFVDLLTQGFVHKFIIVFGSLGRKTFIKVRQATYDGIAIGYEDDGFLVFKYHQKDHRVPISKDERFFYRFLFCQWVDMDGEKWALCKCDYSPVSGYDPVKIQNFLKRILMAPKADDNTFKILMICFLVVGLLVIANVVFNVIIYQKVTAILANQGAMQAAAKTVTPATI